MNRLLIVRLGSLGDLVHTLPAASALRQTFPGAQIDWLVDAVHAPFLALVPILSSVVVLQNRTVAAWQEARRALKDRDYDVALDFQGLVKSAALARLSGARRVIGFDRASLRERAAAMFYTETVEVGDAAREPPHVIEKNLRLAAALGARTSRWEFPLTIPDSATVRQWRAAHPQPFVVINPSAAWPNKCWPPESFGDVARFMSEQGWRPVVLWGPGERERAEAVVRASGGTAIVAPETSTADLIAFFHEAGLMISGDTGPAHIAAALGVPVVGLFGPTDPKRNGPWHDDDIAISRYATCDCHYRRECQHSADRWCLGTITVDEVRAALRRRNPTCHP